MIPNRTSRRPASAAGLVLALAWLAVLSPQTGTAAPGDRLPPGRDFGAGITLRRAIPLEKALRKPGRYADRPVLLKARVNQVCQKKGCWMTLIAPEPVRVRFKDYAFFVPKTSGGHDAYVEGVLSEVEVPEATARHYAEDAGEDPSTIVGPQRGFEFLATGVRLLGMADAPDPARDMPQTRPRSE